MKKRKKPASKVSESSKSLEDMLDAIVKKKKQPTSLKQAASQRRKRITHDSTRKKTPLPDRAPEVLSPQVGNNCYVGANPLLAGSDIFVF